MSMWRSLAVSWKKGFEVEARGVLALGNQSLISRLA
jgi:hypothetical protein